MRQRVHKLLIVASLTGFAAILLKPSALVVQAQPVNACDTATTPFCSSSVMLPANWHGHVFALSQDYPTTVSSDTTPWLAFDPKTQPQQYLQAVLDYFYEGNLQANDENSFDPKLNSQRMWFNAPWQDFSLDVNAREPIHGLTRERVSRPFELGPMQSHEWNNYAVGFYNALGGSVIGKVWADHGRPDASQAGNLPEGTVAAKLLFTTAPVSEVPFLQGAPEWDAYIYANPNDPNPNARTTRAVQKVRLLQIDMP
ncbi:hypothetical protein [Methylocella sp.]|uniref:hypothetical protein n=1 Tax=Methylocella sp. TaxID=1978226 RepID=UPI00378303E4